MKKEVLRMEHVSVRYAGRNVLEDFHLNIYEGEFLFVYGYPDSGIRELGELLRGSRTADAGRFYIGEKEIPATAFENPGSLGIYLVSNENNLVEDFSIAENLFFGGKKRFFQHTVSKKKQVIMARRLLEKFGLDDFIDPEQKARNAALFDQILLKMVMAYVRGAKILVLDGIFGVDTERGDNQLLEHVLRILLDDGIAILWMNQRMSQARELADRVLVMLKGHNVRTVYKGYEEILDHLVYDVAQPGGPHSPQHLPEDKNEEDSLDAVLELDSLSSAYFRDMSFKVHAGEIVSVCSMNARLMENWRNVITGVDPDYQGIMKLDGRAFRPRSYDDSIEQGVCYLDMMWYEKQCNRNMRIEDNLMLPVYWRRNGILGIMNTGYREHVRNLYWVNHPDWPRDYWWKLTSDQQKTLLLEQLCLEPHRLVIITEPFFQLHNTMLDEFYRLIRKVRDSNGAVVLMAIVDMDVRAISDRVIYLDRWTK